MAFPTLINLEEITAFDRAGIYQIQNKNLKVLKVYSSNNCAKHLLGVVQKLKTWTYPDMEMCLHYYLGELSGVMLPHKEESLLERKIRHTHTCVRLAARLNLRLYSTQKYKVYIADIVVAYIENMPYCLVRLRDKYYKGFYVGAFTKWADAVAFKDYYYGASTVEEIVYSENKETMDFRKKGVI